MKESILFAPSLNGTEFLRTMARFNINTLGFRIVSSVELAETALMRSGMTIGAEYISKKEAPSVIYRFLGENGYFSASSYADAENLYNAINDIRMMIPREERRVMTEKLSCGEFPQKNRAVLGVYTAYTGALESGNRADDIALIRKAAEHAEAFDADFIILEEFPLKPLELELLKRVSGGKYRCVTMPDILCVEKKDIREPVITEAYGKINEVSHIVSDIYSRKIAADDCIVACSDTGVYAQLFYDISTAYDIPVSFGCGISIMNSYPAKLLKSIYEWNTDGYNGVKALKKIVFSDAFDRGVLASALGMESIDFHTLDSLCTMAGNLRISTDACENRKRIAAVRDVCNEDETAVIDYAGKLASEFERGLSYFVDRYSIRRVMPGGEINRLDTAAAGLIADIINGYVKNIPDGDVNDILPDIFHKVICNENSKPGALHVVSVNGAVSSLRKHLYVCGLSSLEFPGSASENYIILDRDAEMFDDGVTAPTSANRIKRKKRDLECLLETASALGIDTALSYSGYSLSELKAQNPSSELYRIYERVHRGCRMDDFKKSIISAGYFDDGLSLSQEAGRKYSDGVKIAGKNKETAFPETSGLLEKHWSPSSLAAFVACPMRFYLVYAAGAEEYEQDNIFSVTDARETGLAAHNLMEMLVGGSVTREEFMKEAGAVFDACITRRPPLLENLIDGERKSFLDMMGSAFDLDPRNKVVSSEIMKGAVHPSGVKLRGKPDRVECLPDGCNVVVDFKTGNRIEHNKDDFDTCFQTIVYAWICAVNGIDVTSCEYRYLKKRHSVNCRYDSDMESRLAELLEQFSTAAESGEFPLTENRKKCSYCKVSKMCTAFMKFRETEAGENV